MTSKTEYILVFLLFSLFSYLFLGANVIAGEIVAPMDLLFQYTGWQECGLYLDLINMQRSDIADAAITRWVFIRNSIMNGELPLWNPFISGGEPALFLLQNSTFSIGFILFLIFGDGLGFTFTLLVRLIIAGSGAYFLCRTEFDPVPSFFAGITYMMCGYTVSWLMWSHVETSAWIPWVLLAIIRLDKKPNMNRMFVLSFVVMALILAGFPSVAAYTLYFAVIFVTWLMLSKYLYNRNIGDFKSIMFSLGGIGLGFALTSIQLIPMLEYIQQFDTSWRTALSIPPSNIILLIDPFRFGLPLVEQTGYVGLLPIFLAVFAITYSFFKRCTWRGPFSLLFWGPLTILTLILVYGTPGFLAKPIYLLPVFNNNPNNRLLALFGLELAVLGSIGLQIIINETRVRSNYSSRKLKQVLPMFLILIIISIHIMDISRVGRSQNAVVPANTFFPITPSILYVQENILPGQSVLATTEAFHKSGTLSTYGLPEWFAHSYHKTEEKTLLEKIVQCPWVSPTVASFYYNQIDMNSKLMDALGVRYVLTSSKSLYIYMAQTCYDKPAPPMPSNILGQIFNIEESIILNGMELYLATYGRPTAEGTFILSLYQDDELISESSVNGNSIKDNIWVKFSFDKPVSLFAGKYRFELRMLDAKAPPATIWTCVGKDEFRDGYMIVNGVQSEGDLCFKIISTSPVGRPRISNDWNVVIPVSEIMIFERKSSPIGAYFLEQNSSFDVHNLDFQNWEKVELIRYGANSQLYLVNANSSGWIVRVARYWPGWNCYINGSLIENRPYLGVLPAAYIDPGNYIVEWRYEPLSLKIGATISVSTLTFILIFSLYNKKKEYE